MDTKIKDLRDAVLDGDVELMTEIINSGLAIRTDIGGKKSSVFCTQDTALVLASKHGQYGCVKKLLEIGSSIYIDGEEQFSYRSIAIDFIGALVNAASKDHLNCLQLLAETRILNSCPEDDHYTHLLKEIKEHIDDLEYVKDLLASLGDGERESVLVGWKGHNLMSLFLLHGCDISFLVDDYGIPLNGWDFNGLTPLLIAILTKDLKSAKFLLTKGANVKVPELNCVDVFRSDGLFDREFDEEWDSGNNRTALMYAACVANPEMVSLILEFTPEEVVNWCEASRGSTPVMFAASAGDVESVSLFVNHGALVNIIDYSGISPIDCAVTSENEECVEFLLKITSPEFYPNAFSLSILRDVPQLLLCFMKYYNEKDFVDFLDQSYLMDAIVYDTLKTAQVLLDNGHQIDFRNSTGMTALMFACLEGKDKGVELLLKNGADVNAQTHEGITPLMFTVCNDHVKCLKLLMDYQADVNVMDNYTGTVFSAAISHKGSCLDVLLDSGELFDNAAKKRLKRVHSEAMTVFQSRGYLPVSNLVSAMQHGIFDFEWTNLTSLTNISFAAVFCGISPGKFIRNNSMVSPLTYAFQECTNWGVIKYLIANLYFFPEDYTDLKQQSTIMAKDRIPSPSESDSVVPVSFYDTISCQPLSLKVWSFLHISKAISQNHRSNSNILRSSLVKSLPIPDPLKMKLSFQSPYSQICMKDWDRIGPNDDVVEFHQLTDLIFEKKSFWKGPVSLKRCSANECDCEDLGRVFEA